MHWGCHQKRLRRYLESCGIFDVPTVAADRVYATEEDLEIFRRRGVTVALNPVSNMKLDSGICSAEDCCVKA